MGGAMNSIFILFAISLGTPIPWDGANDLSLRLGADPPGLQAIDQILLVLASRAEESSFRPSGGLRTERIQNITLKVTWDI